MRRVRGPWPAATGASADRLLDAAWAVGVTAVALFGTFLAGRNQPDHRELDLLAVALLCAAGIALLWRRRHPVAVLVATFAITFAYQAFDFPEGPVWGALVIAFFTAYTGGHRTAGFAVLAVGWTSAWWLPALQGGAPPGAGEVVAFTAWLLAVAAVAEVVRARRALIAQAGERRREAERTRAEQARRRQSEERLRIARELHDVVAHTISLVNVQASSALHLIDERPEHAKPALAAIKAASGDALGELRALLDTLRGAEDPAARAPAPTLARLDDVVDRARAAGLEVERETTGTPRPLPAAVELAAFRICQESVTNVLRHAGEARATIRLRYGADALELEVADDGPGGTGHAGGAGKGLTGMRERAAALGGELEAGPRPGGGYAVRAHLPLRTEEAVS